MRLVFFSFFTGKVLIVLSILFSFKATVSAETVAFNLGGQIIKSNVSNWRSLRDKQVVKQTKDFSCGAASIATVLTYYYGRVTTENEILNLLNEVSDTQGVISFAHMELILPILGFKGIGLATSWNQLVELKIPVIVYVRHRKQDHFTVISGIGDKRVKLSDPSLGNRILTRGQFKKIWETRDEKDLEGKMLAILPIDKEIANNADEFFFIKPPRTSRLNEDLIILKQAMRQ